MGFKEQVEADRHSVFVNLAEFGEDHTVDGKTVRCVIDQRDRGSDGAAYGVSQDGLRIFARSEDMPARRLPGMVMSVDGIAYMVESWGDDMGVAEVTCTRRM